MVNRRPLFTGLVLATALATAACASGRFRVSGAQMCQAHGGTYDAAAKTCTYTSRTMSARDACMAHPTGYWDDAAGFCEMGNP